MERSRLDRVQMNKPIRESTYETLKHAIIMGDIPAGSRLIETVYAESLHISRTPLREAFRKLELDGLVEYVERRGVVVRAFTIEDIEETFTIRNALMMLIIPSIFRNVTARHLRELHEILEAMDVSQKAEDADELAVLNRAFHGTIENISDKRRILRVIESQEEYVLRFSHMAIASIVRRSNAQQEHHDLLRMLEKGEETEFSALMAKHLNESMLTCLSAVSLRRSEAR
ncbi:MAG: GntR family transcriptional regulator, partial [Clostridiales bacterium]|nr:GntR family transcriptional regulator [Clostridiales bacterium]